MLPASFVGNEAHGTIATVSKLADYILERNPEHADLVRWLDQDPDYLPADVRAIVRARAEQALCILAQPYADEPDFDEAWRL